MRQTLPIYALFCLSLVTGPTPLIYASPADDLQKADTLNERRWEASADQEGMDLCAKVIAAEPHNAEAYWKASRAAWWLGSVLTKRADRLEAFNKGIAWGKEAVRLAPTSAEAHFWLAGNYGSLGDVKGVMKSLSLLGPIRKELEEMNKIDDRYQSGGAYRILGIIDYKVPGFAGGNKKRAKERLEKALAIDPNHPATLYYLAEYNFEMKDKVAAKEYLDRLEKARQPSLEAEWKLMEAKAVALRKAL